MSVFVDTSAFVALANSDDARHPSAAKAWAELLARPDPIITSNYVVCEAVALLQNRHGTAAVRRFTEEMLPAARIEWVDAAVHDVGLAAVLAVPGKSGPSLTDCTSFELIRRHRIESVFAYDRHFTDRQFNLTG